MAIDRTKAYYKEWENDRGWNMRFEVIPSGEFVNALNNIDAVTYVAMPRGMITIKSHKMSFQNIPFGVRDAASIEVEFDFTDLPTNLKDMLKNPFFEHTPDGAGYAGLITTNIFVLKSDRGTNGASSFIEFCGGQKATLANSYTMTRDPSTGAFVTKGCTIEAIDVLRLVLEQTTTASWAAYILAHPGVTNLQTKSVSANGVREWLLSTNNAQKYDYEPYVRRFGIADNIRCLFYSGAYLFNDGILATIKTNLAAWTRNTPSTYNATCENSPFTAITFYKQDLSLSHTKSTTLAEDEVLILGQVLHSGTTNTGMLLDDKNGESYLEFTYLWDLLKNMCEGMCCKFIYKPLMVADTLSVSRLSYALNYEKIFHNPSNTLQDLSARFGDAQESDFDFTPCSGVYTTVTAEIPNMTEPDINHFDALITGTQSDERINVRLLNHNLPTSNLDGQPQMQEQRIYPRKLYYNYGGAPLKVHESVRINDQLSYTDYDNVTALPSLAASSGGFASEQRVADCSGWALQTQLTNGLGYAVSNFYLSRFSSNSQNEIPVTMYMVDGETMPENCGDIVTIPTIDGFAGTEKAVMLDMEADWQKGTIDITFITRGA